MKKQVHIIARYSIKRNGHICYAVKSSNGKDTYCTTLVNGKATGCTCPAVKPCYHMKQLEIIEAQRQPVAVVETVATAPVVTAIEEKKQTFERVMKTSLPLDKLKTTTNQPSTLAAMQAAALKATLNGSSQGFSLMRR